MVSETTPVNIKGKQYGFFGERIVAERERLKLKQVDICIRTGVSKTTQIKYEASQRTPDIEYLAALDGAGFDIMYIVTGSRSEGALNDEFQNLIEAYQAASDDLKRAAFAVLLSPWKKGYLDKPIKEPGYFQHQILGVDDLRYENRNVQTMLMAAEPLAEFGKPATAPDDKDK